jgi:sulfur carrier protein ThiS
MFAGLVTAGLSAVGAVAVVSMTLSMLESTGRVVVAPPPPPRPTSAALPARMHASTRAVAFELPSVENSMLALTEPATHDPAVLLVRARELERAGLPLRVMDVVLPPWETPTLTPFQVHAVPITTNGRGSDGIEIATVPKFSLLARAGFVQGDVVVSVNGYAAAGTAWADHVFVNADRGGLALVELVRDGRRIALAVAWPAAPRG